MTRNEYRRALIMLRALQRGYSGHVRLERRTTLGSMCFSVSEERSMGTLYGVLVGRRKDDYYAAALGELRRDCRGQAMLNAGFDPRNIAGKPLEAYQLVTVLSVEEKNCELVLAGNINGSFEMNWLAVRNAACALFVRTVEPRRESEDMEKEQDAHEQTGVSFAEPTSAPDPQGMGTDVADVGKDLQTGDLEKISEIGTEIHIKTKVCAETEMDGSDEKKAEKRDTYTQTPVCNAASMLQIRPGTEWPESLAAVQNLFDMSTSFEEINVPGYVFVRAPLPENAGYGFCAIGIHAENGKPKSVCYALPAAFSSEPPAGLEGYVWRGEGNDGWWMVFLDAETGEEIEPVP